MSVEHRVKILRSEKAISCDKLPASKVKWIKAALDGKSSIQCTAEVDRRSKLEIHSTSSNGFWRAGLWRKILIMIFCRLKRFFTYL
jgi:hypothetical protein